MGFTITLQCLMLDAILAIASFYLINWVGGHTFDTGYMQLSMFHKVDEAPAFNFLFRVISPAVLISIYSVAFYSFGFDNLVKSIWLVVPLIFVYRASYNIVQGRSRLMNWSVFLSHSLLATLTALLLYHYLIIERRFLFPDLQTIGNEFWLLIALFVYQISNNLRTNTAGSKQRKEKYLLETFERLRKKYKAIIEKDNVSQNIQVLTYSIMIIENFNRPLMYRYVESLSSLFKKRGTYGIMQVSNSKALSDENSVCEGLKFIISNYGKVKKYSAGKEPDYITDKNNIERYIIERVAWLYNNSTDYSSEVMEIYDFIKIKYFTSKVPVDENDKYNAFN